MDKKIALLKMESAIDEIHKVVGEEKCKQVNVMQLSGLIINTMEGLEQYKKYSFNVFRTHHFIGLIIDNVKSKIGEVAKDLTEIQLENLTKISYEINKATYQYMSAVEKELLPKEGK